MYLPAHFKEERPEVLHELMRKFPLAALVTYNKEGLEANHIPLLLDTEAGVLRGHMARANPQWRTMCAGEEALAIFQGPASYVSPNWYPTKKEHGRVVPTWNYAVVHAHGQLVVYEDADRLRKFLGRLTAEHESTEPMPWLPEDAPADYIKGLLGAIVGIELRIAMLVGKWKMSQNQPAGNRQAVSEKFAGRGLGELADLTRPQK